jgi:acyl transferase domain-containing protein
MGHSVGELAAMCVAGGVSLDDGLRLVAARGRLMQALPPGGVMASVMADEARVREAMAGREDRVAVAALNAPGQVVISGDGVAVAEVTARLEATGVKTKTLTVSHAFHSPLMKPMLAEYERLVRQTRFSPPSIRFVSCVDSALSGVELTQPEYWLRNVIDPVRFVAGMEALAAEKVNACVEVGPHPVLLGMGRQCAPDDDGIEWLPSLRKDGDGWQTLLGSVARLYARGAAIDWRSFDAPYARRRLSVPTYAFTEKEYWLRSLARPADMDAQTGASRSAEGVRHAAGAQDERAAGPAPTPQVRGERASARYAGTGLPCSTSHPAIAPATFLTVGRLRTRARHSSRRGVAPVINAPLRSPKSCAMKKAMSA